MRLPKLCCFRPSNRFTLVHRVRLFWQGRIIVHLVAYQVCRRCGRLRQQ